LFASGHQWFEEGGVTTLSKFFLLFVLMSVLGGINQIFASFGFTQIRVWSRASIVIGFLALIALGYFLESISNRWKLKPISIGLAAFILLCLGVIDTNRIVPEQKYSELSDSWHNDNTLVKGVENTFGPGARVLQIPILKFPEQGSVYQLSDYAQLRGQLHSDSLCWSYGSVIGRDDNRTERWKELPIKDLIEQARAEGFDALWLELRGYADSGAQISAEISTLIDESILQDRFRYVEIFDLRKNSNFRRMNCH
jgi:phosphoglycerol transferase